MNRGNSNQLFQFFIPSSKNYFVLFLLWPFLAFITAMANYSQKEAKKIVYMFLIYYGFTFVIKSDGYVDALGYAMRLEANSSLPFSDFFRIVGGLYSDTTVDIVEPLISFIVSRFTSHHSVYFAVWASIFGYFYLRSINMLHERYREQPGWNALIIMIFFIMVMPITAVSGVRMWTATWIFFYGSCQVIIHRDPRYLLLTLASSLVHWSFLTVNVILIIYYIAGNRNVIYLPITLLSFLLPQLMAPVFQSISLQAGGALQNRYEGYSSEDYILGIQESYKSASWFMGLSDKLIFYYVLLVIVIMQLRYGSRSNQTIERNMFSFLLLFLSLVNFGRVIPTFGGRFEQVFFLYASFYIFLCYYKLPGKKISFPVLIGLFPMALYSAIMFRLGSESISAWIFAPGLGLPLLTPVMSVADLLFK